MSPVLTTDDRKTGVQPSEATPRRSVCLPAAGLELNELLGVLNDLRRGLARSTRGHEGAFAGFDVLDFRALGDDDRTGHITVAARVVADHDSTQVVEYSAAACAHADGRCSSGTGEKYLQARGTTVALTRPQNDRVAQSIGSKSQPFVIASPHR